MRQPLETATPTEVASTTTSTPTEEVRTTHDDIFVGIPLHSSSISCLESPEQWRRLLLCFAAMTLNYNNGGHDNDDSSRADVETTREDQVYDSSLLILQSNSEGVMWKGLMPALTSEQSTRSTHQPSNCQNDFNKHNPRNVSSLLVSILVDHFKHRICPIQLLYCKSNNHNRDNHNNAGSHCILNHESFGSWVIVPCPMMVNNLHSKVPLFVIILPPNPQIPKSLEINSNGTQNIFNYSRVPSHYPLSLFTKRLIYNENSLIRLTSISAYISTLGGGFFLCRYLSTAVSLARQQCHIALLRGDEEMAFKCRINEGYCYIHAGKLKKAKKIIKRVYWDVVKRQEEKAKGLSAYTSVVDGRVELDELTIIKSMCRSALWFADKIREAGLSDINSAAHDGEQGEQCIDLKMQGGSDSNDGVGNSSIGDKHSLSATHDDFQRIRIVRDRKYR